MVRRDAAALVRARLRGHPAVALIGPRQCGKTTLARAIGGEYFDLEQPEERLRLDLEWEALAAGRRLVILDEAQAWPEIFPRLRGAIDRQRSRHGRFLILGSVSPILAREVSESLAGRLALCELTPLLLGEVPPKRASALWLAGGYPDGGILSPRRFPSWQADYLALLAQRDLPGWGLLARPQLTERLFRMLAASHGATWNASAVGASLGLTYHTVDTYVDYLEGAFLVRRLPPYSRNVGKRLVKRPKLYWRDSGLLHALLNVSDERQLLSQPWVGASWEGFVIEQVLASLLAAGVPFDASYFRTSDGHEVDLIVEVQAERWAIEAKLTTAPGPEDVARLDRAADLLLADRRVLVTRASRTVEDGRRVATNLPGLLDRLPG